MVYTSSNADVREFLKIRDLLDILETSDDKQYKVNEIKAARDSGLISEADAIDLAVEFC